MPATLTASLLVSAVAGQFCRMGSDWIGSDKTRCYPWPGHAWRGANCRPYEDMGISEYGWEPCHLENSICVRSYDAGGGKVTGSGRDAPSGTPIPTMYWTDDCVCPEGSKYTGDHRCGLLAGYLWVSTDSDGCTPAADGTILLGQPGCGTKKPSVKCQVCKTWFYSKKDGDWFPHFWNWLTHQPPCCESLSAVDLTATAISSTPFG